MGIKNGKGRIILLLALFLCFTSGCRKKEDWSKYSTLQLFQADPTIFYEKGTYYLYGTNETDASQGFHVFTSGDLVHWTNTENSSLALKKGTSFGNGGFWAPQVFFYKNLYYMAYTADEQIAIAESKSPLGPFTQSDLKPLFQGMSYKTIDPYVFFDDDGQIYLYFVKQNGGNNIYVVKMKDDLSGIGEGDQIACITATEPWENTEKTSWPVTEGPTVIKKDGTYYLFYSANDFRNPDYAVGYATSKSPLGPWDKREGPIISRDNIGENGTGHGDIVAGKDKQLYYVLHTHSNNVTATPRKTAIVKLNYELQKDGVGVFSVNKNSFSYLKQYKK
ncbi:glycoside hydrolase family 43 protein [Anaerocolumna sp. MB42-C2]|uniref:glycoside hydrolase family 43 protein n=1 Tax=Anaerocolumna sp. MB42-C2 TaxID=3070997 RepID=UPI0027E16DF7|nr:glycoside hydrolase family 43 protein [Anaerocolumna sp. MB42-C2]WMJ85860.1 glycoside hydrolase family 43 protein [Anaerocolumna sp. MB42-C2]